MHEDQPAVSRPTLQTSDPKLPELTISVITPAFNAAHYLVHSLPPLMRLLESGAVCEVIVVDDCSSDGTTRAAIEASGATYLATPRNGGPGFARNFAAAAAKGDLLWFVDADVVIDARSALRIQAHFLQPTIWAMFGSYDANPPARNFASQYKNLVHRHYHQRGRLDASTFWSGCGVVRRDHFLSLGGFDVDAFHEPSIEDIELGYRMRDAGGRIVLDPEFMCTHLKDWTLKEVVLNDVLKRALPWSRLLVRRTDRTSDLNVSTSERIRAGVSCLWLASALMALTGSFGAVVPAVALGLTVCVGIMNWRLGAYFARIHGLAFAVAAVLFHQVYYVYSALTFLYARLRPAH